VLRTPVQCAGAAAACRVGRGELLADHEPPPGEGAPQVAEPFASVDVGASRRRIPTVHEACRGERGVGYRQVYGISPSLRVDVMGSELSTGTGSEFPTP